MAYPHKWSPISYKSSAGQRKHIGQRPMLYRWTTPPTKRVSSSCALLGGFAIGARVSLLWQQRRTRNVSECLYSLCIFGFVSNEVRRFTAFINRATLNVAWTEKCRTGKCRIGNRRTEWDYFARQFCCIQVDSRPTKFNVPVVQCWPCRNKQSVNSGYDNVKWIRCNVEYIVFSISDILIV